MRFILYKFSQLSISSLSLGLSANTSQYYPCACLEDICLFLSCESGHPLFGQPTALRSSWVENVQEALYLDLSLPFWLQETVFHISWSLLK